VIADREAGKAKNTVRVVHVHFGKDGGAERFFVHLVRALGVRGVEQRAIIRPNRNWRQEIEPFAEITESNFRDVSLDRLVLPLKVRSIINNWKPDAMLGWMPRACRLLPGSASVHRMGRLGDYPLSLRSFGNVDTLVCNTPGIAEHVRQLGWTRGLQVISNFTNTEHVAPVSRASLATPEDCRLIVSMGRFVERKGFDVLIRTLPHLQNTWLWLIGDGEERQNLELLAGQLGVADRIRFMGWKADPRPWVSAADVFGMASSHEPLGNVILEAWAQRVPVVATRSEGPQWFMRDQENGLMVDIGDSEGFVSCFRRLFSDQTLAARIVEGGRNSLMSGFSESAVAELYMQQFTSRSRQSARAA
jgi:glycosyltransferase involved in cell wall biosynthesis